jgi:hypothetical protein
MNKIKTFVSKLLKGLFNDEDKKELIEILTISLEEKVDDLVEAGTPLDEAIDKSISEFGGVDDVLEAYPELNKKKALIKKRKLHILRVFCRNTVVCDDIDNFTILADNNVVPLSVSKEIEVYFEST